MTERPPPNALEAPLRLTVGLPPAWRRLRWLPLALALLSAWLVGLTALQSLLVAVLAAVPVYGSRERWAGATLVLRPDGSAELAHGMDSEDGVSGRQAWLFGGLAVVELRCGSRGPQRLVVSSARNRDDDWRRLRGWIRLGRLGPPEDPGFTPG